MALSEIDNLLCDDYPYQSSRCIYKRSGFDRRSGYDRRSVYNMKYLLPGVPDRRKNTERRRQGENREGWVRINKWASICSLFNVKIKY